LFALAPKCHEKQCRSKQFSKEARQNYCDSIIFYYLCKQNIYILDEQGIITHIFTPKQIKTKEHAEQILKL